MANLVKYALLLQLSIVGCEKASEKPIDEASLLQINTDDLSRRVLKTNASGSFEYACDGGSTPKSNGCCSSSNSCPSGCSMNSMSFINGMKTCNCAGCPLKSGADRTFSYTCSGGAAPQSNGCCPDTNKCPSGCSSNSYSSTNGVKMCGCAGCPSDAGSDCSGSGSGSFGYLCSAGVSPQSNGCCPGSNSCPAGCSSSSTSSNNGVKMCSCAGCPLKSGLAPKFLYTCSGGAAPQSNGCCAGNKCPSGCSSNSVSSSNGVFTCSCAGCPGGTSSGSGCSNTQAATPAPTPAPPPAPEPCDTYKCPEWRPLNKGSQVLVDDDCRGMCRATTCCDHKATCASFNCGAQQNKPGFVCPDYAPSCTASLCCEPECDYQCYMDRYGMEGWSVDVAKKHYEDFGKKEGRVCTCPPKECNWACYLQRYPKVEQVMGANHCVNAQRHFELKGAGEGRDCTCKGITTTKVCAKVERPALISSEHHRHETEQKETLLKKAKELDDELLDKEQKEEEETNNKIAEMEEEERKEEDVLGHV